LAIYMQALPDPVWMAAVAKSMWPQQKLHWSIYMLVSIMQEDKSLH